MCFVAHRRLARRERSGIWASPWWGIQDTSTPILFILFILSLSPISVSSVTLW